MKGATVRKASTFCDGGLSVSLGATAPVGSSFVLTANQNDGNTVDDSDFNIGRLNDAGSAVDFNFGSTCGGPQSMLAQVVTLPNIVVTRGVNTMAMGSLTRGVADPPAPSSGVLLAQWRAPVSGAGICDRTIRTELQGASVNFSRGNASATCAGAQLPAIVWDKIDFKNTASVQQVGVTMGVGTGLMTTTINAVDRTRTLVFTGAQGSTGQAIGEGTHPGTTNTTDYLGDVSAALTLAGAGYQSTSLSSRRGSTLGSSKWTVYVVELNP